MANLSYGSRGPEVAEAQAALIFHALPGDEYLDPDGKFGDATRRRTVAFQRLAGLVDDGIIGFNTRQALLATTEVMTVGRTLYFGQVEARPPLLAFAGRQALSPRQPMPTGRALLAQLPPLTPPVVGAPPAQPGWTPKLTLDIPLMSGVPATLPSRPPSGEAPEMELFVLNGAILKPLGSKPDPTPQPFLQLTPTSRFESLTTTRPGPAEFGRFSLDIYLKAKMANKPEKPGDAEIKFLGGAKFSFRLGRFTIGAEAEAPFFEISSAGGKAEWSPAFEGKLTLTRHF